MAPMVTDSPLIADVDTKRVHDPIGESPLSVTQPLEESFAEISLPVALGSTGARKQHLLSPNRNTGKCSKAVLTSAIALVGTLAVAVCQAPVSGVGRSSLLLPDSLVAEVPSALLILGVWAYLGARGEMMQLIELPCKAVLAYAIALGGTITVAVYQALVSCAERSCLPLLDHVVAEVPSALLVLSMWAYLGARGKMLQLI